MQVLKKLNDGREVQIEKVGEDVRVFIDGELAEVVQRDYYGYVCQIRSKGSGGVTHRLGHIGLTDEEARTARQLLGESQVQLTDAAKERLAIEKMMDGARAIQDRDYVGSLQLMEEARIALRNWRRKYPQEAAQEDEERREAKEEKRRRIERGFAARGLD